MMMMIIVRITVRTVMLNMCVVCVSVSVLSTGRIRAAGRMGTSVFL